MTKQVFSLKNKTAINLVWWLMEHRDVALSARFGNDSRINATIREFHDGDGTDFYIGSVLVGKEANSIGPHGTSSFWDWEEDEYGDKFVVSTEPPQVDGSIFLDGGAWCHCYQWHRYAPLKKIKGLSKTR